MSCSDGESDEDMQLNICCGDSRVSEKWESEHFDTPTRIALSRATGKLVVSSKHRDREKKIKT